MKTMKRMLRISLAASVAVAFLIVAGAVLAHTSPVKRRLLAHAQNYVRGKFAAELEINRFEFSLLKGAVSVEGLTLGSAAAPDLAPLLRVKRADVNLDLISTLFGSASIESVRLENPEIHILAGQDGRSNLPGMGAEGGGDGGGLRIRSLEMTEGSLVIEDSSQRIRLHLPSWRIEGRGRGSDLLSHILLETNAGGTVDYQGKRFEVGSLEIESEMSDSSLKILALRLDAVGSKLKGSGIIRRLSDPIFDLRIDAEVDLERAADFFGLTPGVKGRAGGTITIAGPLGNLQIGGDLQGVVASAVIPDPSESPARDRKYFLSE